MSTRTSAASLAWRWWRWTGAQTSAAATQGQFRARSRPERDRPHALVRVAALSCLVGCCVVVWWVVLLSRNEAEGTLSRDEQGRWPPRNEVEARRLPRDEV